VCSHMVRVVIASVHAYENMDGNSRDGGHESPADTMCCLGAGRWRDGVGCMYHICPVRNILVS
jgi:hypothetical protein